MFQQKIICCLLVSLLVGYWATAQAQGTGDSPCRALFVASTVSSALTFESDGKIVHDGEGSEPGFDVAVMPNAVPKDDNGWVEIRLDAFGTPIGEPDPLVGALELGMEDDEGRLSYFTISAGENATHQRYRNDGNIGTFEATFSVGDVLRIEREGTNLLLRRAQGNELQTLATIADVAASSTRFRVRLANRSASTTPQYTSYSTGSCPPYVVLRHRLDGSFLQQTDEVLRFKFKQQYATLNGSTEDIAYRIYDWERNVVQSGTFQVSLGMNWRTISISSLPDATFYTFEITANKEEQYFLRFKTKQP